MQPSYNMPPRYNMPPSTFGMYEKPRQKTDSGSTACIKYLMVAGSIMNFLLAIAAVAITAWIIKDHTYVSKIYGNELITAGAWLIVISSGLLLLASLYGFFGVLSRQLWILTAYVIVLIILAVLLFVGAILVVVFTTQIKDSIQYGYMTQSLQQMYGVHLQNKQNMQVTQSWDSAQIKLRCCGVTEEGWIVYQQSEWFKSQPGDPGQNDNQKLYVPQSCCAQDLYGQYYNLNECQKPNIDQPPRARNSKEINEAVNYRGCYEAGKEEVRIYGGVLIGVGFGMAFLVVASIIGGALLIIAYRKRK